MLQTRKWKTKWQVKLSRNTIVILLTSKSKCQIRTRIGSISNTISLGWWSDNLYQFHRYRLQHKLTSQKLKWPEGYHIKLAILGIITSKCERSAMEQSFKNFEHTNFETIFYIYILKIHTKIHHWQA